MATVSDKEIIMGSRYKLLISISIFLSLITSVNAAVPPPFRIEVFTTSIQSDLLNIPKLERLTKSDVDVYFVDQSKNQLDKLNNEMARKKFNSEAEIAAFMDKFKRDPAFQNKLKQMTEGATSFVSAMSYGIDKVPAVVFDEKFIVYGELPLTALTIYNKAKAKDAAMWVDNKATK